MSWLCRSLTRIGAGAGLNEPMRLTANNHPALRGVLTAATVRELVGEYDFPVEYFGNDPATTGVVIGRNMRTFGED